MEAITAVNCQMGFNYERLETLGDTFLKMSFGLHFFHGHPDKSEGGQQPLAMPLVNC